MERIKLQRLPNTRDLGQFKNADGRKIKSHRLIRSGALLKATKKDIEILKNEYNLKKIVDFRTDMEVTQKPDPRIDGVEYIRNSIMNHAEAGITYDEDSPKNKPFSMIGLIKSSLGKIGDDPLEFISKLYLKLITQEYSINQYKKFFDIVLENKEGAVLYHCTAGKDRVGTATILLLSALGVSRETIRADYLFTNECLGGLKWYESLFLKLNGIKPKQIEIVALVNSVKERYIDTLFDEIDKNFANVEDFLEKRFGLDKEKVDKLKENYLE